MRRFKLIKKYPGSPKLNSVFNYWTDNISEQVYDGNIYIPLKIIEEYKEFWEEVKEKDYEILSFKSTTKHPRPNEIITLDNNTYNYQIKPSDISCNIEEMLESLNNNYVILYSVKRLSDSEVFTVGDSVDTGGRPYKILSFETDDELKIRTKNPHTSWTDGLGVYLRIEDDYRTTIRNIQKVKKQPLFKTEDGVSMYTGNTVWHTNINYTNLKNCIWSSIVDQTEPFTPIKGLFSTKEAAEEYVVLNKPVLSINEILNVFNNGTTSFKPKLEELVKQKLK